MPSQKHLGKRYWLHYLRFIQAAVHSVGESFQWEQKAVPDIDITLTVSLWHPTAGQRPFPLICMLLDYVPMTNLCWKCIVRSTISFAGCRWVSCRALLRGYFGPPFRRHTADVANPSPLQHKRFFELCLRFGAQCCVSHEIDYIDIGNCIDRFPNSIR